MFQIGDIVKSAENNIERGQSPYGITGGENFKAKVISVHDNGKIIVKVIELDEKFTGRTTASERGQIYPVNEKYFKLYCEQEDIVHLK